MDTQAIKLDLIHWLTELQDKNIIEKLRSFKDSQEIEVTNDLKKLLDSRIDSYENNPNQIRDWNTVMKEIEGDL